MSGADTHRTGDGTGTAASGEATEQPSGAVSSASAGWQGGLSGQGDPHEAHPAHAATGHAPRTRARSASTASEGAIRLMPRR